MGLDFGRQIFVHIWHYVSLCLEYKLIFPIDNKLSNKLSNMIFPSNYFDVIKKGVLKKQDEVFCAPIV